MSAPQSTLSAPKPIIMDKISWPDRPSVGQSFSVPGSIVYYTAQNPSNSKCYSKIIQTCKYFFERNPILVVEDMYKQIKMCFDETCDCDGYSPFDVKIDMSKLPSKFWITMDSFCEDHFISPDLISSFCSKIYRCEITDLTLIEQNFTYDDLKIFAISVKEIILENNRITYKDGSTVMLENVLEILPNIEEFTFYRDNDHSMFNAATIKNITNLQNLGCLKEFSLSSLPQIFNIDDLFTLVQNLKDVAIYLNFDENISQKYKDQLDLFIDTVIKTQIPVFVHYDDQNEEKFKIMEKNFAAKNRFLHKSSDSH